MAGVDVDSLGDLVLLTLDNLGRGKWTDLASDLQMHWAMNSILREERVSFRSGKGISKNLMIDHSGNARHVGLFEQDVLSIADNMRTFRIPWRHTTSNYIFDMREDDINAGEEQIVDLIQTRRADAFTSLAETLEETFWSKPADDSDTTKPFGLFYWLVSNSGATPGFNGGNAAGFPSGPGGIDASANPRWNNFTFTYSQVSELDLVANMDEAFEKTNFRSPVPVPTYDRSARRFGIFTRYNEFAGLKRVAKAQNDQLGFDIEPVNGSLVFRGVPINWVPQLETDTTAPIIMIDWSVFFPVFLSQWYLKETTDRVAGAHTVMAVHVDLTWNLECVNRRRLAIGIQV